MAKNEINYNEGYKFLIRNKVYICKHRYFEPNMSENNFGIIDSIINNFTIIVPNNEYDKFVSFEDKRIKKILEDKRKFNEEITDNLLKCYKYDVEIVDDLSFDKCDVVYVGQTLSGIKYNSSDYEFLSKYNIKNIKSLDAQLFNIFLGIEKLSDDGTMIINIPTTYLYRNDISSMCLRKYLIDNKIIKGIALIKGTCNISDYEIVIEISKKANNSVVFVDAKNNDYHQFYDSLFDTTDGESNSFKTDYNANAVNIFSLIELKKNITGVAEVVDIDKIINNDYCLVVGDYVKTKKKRTHRNLYEIARDIDYTFEKLEENCRYWENI